ncbi:hypothetical protein NKR23_g6120 [Pleurostoma richardsiae]|uniref:Uncharacterized protein n=1 Tax=Pleurostoma richardsiae TaxID=41990 RepID=A0AA38RBT6_9PEZI|nr:hypothetical protein NKR23_g6120 [Pleurostoma richardsiae]
MGTRHDFKLAFHNRLRDECLELEDRGFHVIIAGDLNIARGPLDGYPNLRTWPAQHCLNRADFNTKFFSPEENERADAYVGPSPSKRAIPDNADSTEPRSSRAQRADRFDGVDVFRALHDGERKYTYYPRTREWGASCDRVDLIITSRGTRTQ